MKNFTARHSSGIVFLFGLGLFISFANVVPMFFSLDENPPLIAVMNIGFGALIGLLFVYLALQAKKIKYCLFEDYLEISMGRLIQEKVFYADIKEVVKKNLTISLWSRMRLPGLALFKVPYADEGIVIMCATSAVKDIILIKTETQKFGITPDLEEKFMSELLEKIG